MISIDKFIEETKSKEYDIDHTAGVQCVDGIKVFVNKMLNVTPDFTCGNGWAYGLWTCFGSNGVEKYFNKHSFTEARKGDWIIWNKGSKQAPNSHVGMFIENLGSKVKSYGQNQNGIKAFNYCDVSTDGILGVLRLKELENIEYHKGDSGETILKVDEYLSNKVKGDYFGDYTEACLSVFKRKNGLPDNSIIDKDVLEKMGIN